MKTESNSGLVSGWKIKEWCQAASVSRATFYLLKNRPRMVKIGSRTVVIESPTEYLNRLAELQSGAA